jgi:hypothetical protein
LRPRGATRVDYSQSVFPALKQPWVLGCNRFAVSKVNSPTSTF